MISITNITIRNFLSVGNCTQAVNLSLSPLTLILGETADYGSGINRNGAGKTSLLQAVSYALYGEPLTKVTLDNLCNIYNAKGMLVTIDFERDGKAFRIERGRKPNVLRWHVDGQQKDDAHGKNVQTQAEIDRVIGMSHRMFRHIVALNTFTIPFLREKASEQREIIEELLGITQLSQRADALKRLLDVTKELVRDEEAKLKANGEANARIQQAIDRAQGDADTWQTMHDKQLADLLAKAETVSEIDIDNEIAVFDRIDAWLQAKRYIDEQIQDTARQHTGSIQEIERLRKDWLRCEAAQVPDMRAIERLERQAQQCRTEAGQALQPSTDRLVAEAGRHRRTSEAKHIEANQLASELVNLQQQLADPGSHTCPTCSQKLVGTDHAREVIHELTSRVDVLGTRIKTLLHESDQCEALAVAVDGEIAQARTDHAQRQRDCQERLRGLEDEIVAVTSEQLLACEQAQDEAATVKSMLDGLIQQSGAHAARQDQLQSQIAILGPKPVSGFINRDAVWQLRQQRDALFHQIETEMERPNPHVTKLEGLRATLLAIDYSTLNDLTLKFKHEMFLYKLLTAKDSFIRKKIVDQNLSYLNNRLDRYLSKLGLPHEVRFRPDLGVEIALMGREFDFEQLSRGEMSRVTLAASWAFRDVWQNLNTGFNLMFCDEILDSGIDDAGVEAAWLTLQEMANGGKNIFVVSHRDSLEGRADQVLLVRKEAQFTTFAMAA